jgi:hypothetical protein
LLEGRVEVLPAGLPLVVLPEGRTDAEFPLDEDGLETLPDDERDDDC